LKDVEEGSQENDNFKFIYFPTLLYGSESWTVLTGCDSRVAGAEMR
jgi:hypothetical protein